MARTFKYRNKTKKRPLIPFGDVMIPVIGLVGLGILFFSIKVFFMPKDHNLNKEYSSVVVSDYVSEETGQEKESHVYHEENVIAVPITLEDDSSLADNSLTSKEVKSQGNYQSVKEKPKAVTVDSRPKKVSDASSAKWFVQVGAFKTDSASSRLKKEVRSKGFDSLVVKSKVNGSTYYKVLVPGGNSRDKANQIGQSLQQKGYEYFLVKR